MVLVDTSVWIDHFGSGDSDLVDLLKTSSVLMHPFVVGELACGNLRRRAEILALLNNLPEVNVAQDSEVLVCIERNELMGRGIGYVDAHLLAAVMLTDSTRLWTRDKRLDTLARDLGLGFES